MMKNTMPATRTVPDNAVRMASHFNARKTTARMATPNTPQAAASVGVAMPRMMKPMTMKITRLTGRILKQTSLILRPQPDGGTS